MSSDYEYSYDEELCVADSSLAGDILDLIKEAKKLKQVRRGTDEVAKTINRGVAEFVVLAADTEPLEIVMHIPLLCAEKCIPCIFVPSRLELGKAAHLKHAASAVSVTAREASKIQKHIDSLVSRIEKANSEEDMRVSLNLPIPVAV